MKPIVYERLRELLLKVQGALDHVDGGIDAMRRGGGSPWTWDLVYTAVRQTESALKPLRKRVRAHQTKERRAKCEHPMMSRTAWGVCHKCGQTKLEPRKQEVAP